MKKLTAILFVLVTKDVICLDYDGWLNVKLEHSLNCKQEKFCSRGSIALKSLRTGNAVIDQIHYTKEHLNELKVLADTDETYILRALVTTAESKDVEMYTFTKARSYLEKGLSDIITAWVLPNGEVIALNLYVTNSSEYENFEYNNNREHNLRSAFIIRQVDQAPLPDTASYIQKLEREREAREKGDVKDNRSFLVKYWMYIVPIAIFIMISGAANPEPAGQAAR